MVKTLKEFILNTTQLANTGKEYSIKIFYTDNKKTVVAKLVGIRHTDSDAIEYTIEKNNQVLFGFCFEIKDVESEAQMRYFIRSNLLQLGWKRIGTRDNKI